MHTLSAVLHYQSLGNDKTIYRSSLSTYPVVAIVLGCSGQPWLKLDWQTCWSVQDSSLQKFGRRWWNDIFCCFISNSTSCSKPVGLSALLGLLTQLKPKTTKEVMFYHDGLLWASDWRYKIRLKQVKYIKLSIIQSFCLNYDLKMAVKWNLEGKRLFGRPRKL